jgi:X-Pro dipeptidyl-peptidase
MRLLRLALVVAVIGGLLAPAPALAQSAPDAGTAFSPTPKSQPLYGSKAPDEDPDTQTHYIEGHDGTKIYVETWLPAPQGKAKPPKRVPTVLVMTPYAALGVDSALINYLNARGFAVAYGHVRGTGNSGGCLEQTSADQIKDGAYTVEYLGRDAPWTNGRVGMYGASYDAETQISTAGLGEPKRTKYLKAIIPTASVGSQYDWNYMDGVPWQLQPATGNTSYLAISLIPGTDPGAAGQHGGKADCQVAVMGESANQTGDYTEYWQEREYRPGAPKVRAATLMVHGLRDFNVQPITLAGFFDQLAAGTPHKGLFGVWNHAYPDSHGSVAGSWERADWMDMVVAWFDRYLKGLDTGVERWPDVQVQASSGEWWAVEDFPTTGSRTGQLVLGPKGALGTTSPKGETSYQEQLVTGDPEDGQFAVFDTPKVKAPLHLTGQPMLDLWVMSDTTDGHVGVELEVIGPDGQPMEHQGGTAQATYGVRSLQHIDPMRRGWFQQESGEELVPFEPTRATIRFLPTDLVVPKGGSLRLTVSGSVSYSKGESLTSGSASNITILHDCSHVSALRFRMPDKNAQLLNVREKDEMGVKKLASKPTAIGDRDGAGLATARVCGRTPRALPFQ